MKKFLLVFLSSTLIHTVMAQKNFWSAHTDVSRIVTHKAALRSSFPKDFKLFDLDFAPFSQELFTVVSNRSKSSIVVSLPNADGQIEQFEVFEASNFEPDLQARFPDIRSFSGKGITDRYATLKLSLSPQGVQTMVFRTEKANEFIEAYSQDRRVYAVFKSQRNAGQLPWSCSTPEQVLATGLNTTVANNGVASRSGRNLKTLRLAQSVTAEYSNYFGATSSAQVGLVLAGINATLTRANGIYEKDLALHLNLVAASTNVIYYNASTDPYDNAAAGAAGTWNDQLQSTLTSVIGEANYDIGHLFGASGGGGNAGCIGCICVNGSKGSGYTSPIDAIPQGDNFDIDFVVHEVGHQLGANHTFSFFNESSGVNKEVGSGITIMGYAGITDFDVAPHSIDIFHQASIAQIQANLLTKTCPVTTTITNSTPVVAPVGNFTIPKSTPFALTGSATDSDAGDALTYCWEQNDNSTTTGANSIASTTKTTGPNWLSYRPTASPVRYFPQLSTILAGGLTTGPLPGGDAGTTIEALSSVARILNFRLTVRDNAAYRSTAPVSVGQTNFTNTVVTVSDASGPFAVTVPNAPVSWVGGSLHIITWAVAGTTAPPVSCANVKISLSTDGGLSFPTVLAASTTNDGTQALVIPNIPTTKARIKIEAFGNIFFDISNTNFTITAATSCGDATGLTSSAITTTSATVSWAAVANAVSYAVDYKLNSSGTWTSFSTAQTAVNANITGLSSGSIYNWRVKANCNAANGNYVAAQFTTAVPCTAPTGLTTSSITSGGATVSWTAVSGAASYAVYYKLTSNPLWTSAATATASTSVALSGLATASSYDWRVRTNCASGTSAYTTAQFTTTAAPSCVTAFEANQTQATAAAITPGVTNSAAIGSTTDIDYFKITIAATSNIVYNLVGPAGLDYDLGIYNSAGTQIGYSDGTTATETVSLNGQAAGTYFIKVIGYNGANSATCYTIKATVTASGTGCQSSYDVSTNGTTSGAATIPFNTNITGLISPGADIDNYKVVITTSGTITISLTTLPNDYDLRLLNSAGTQVAISEAGGTTSENISYAVAAGTYYAQVYGFNGANNASSCYTLKVTPVTARDMTSVPSDSRKKILNIFPNPAQDILNISLTGYEGVSEIKVFDMNGREVARNRTAEANSKMNITKLAKAIYLVKVYTADGEVLIAKVMKQ